MNTIAPVLDLVPVARFDELPNRQPQHAKVNAIDLVIIRYEQQVSVLYGRCLHRGALLADGSIEGDNLICGLHRWDYRIDTGISEYNNAEALHKFTTYIENGQVLVDRAITSIYQLFRRWPAPVVTWTD